MPVADKFLPALRFHFMTPLYDLLCRLSREHYFKQQLLKLADIRQEDQILDVGCGTGTLAIMLKSAYPQGEITAIDCDAAILNMAKGKADRRQLEINFIKAFSDAIPLSDGSIASCFSSLFFHHLERTQKKKTLDEIFRLLRKDGQLLIADWGKPANPLMKSLSLSVRFFDGKSVTCDNHNGLLPELIESAGFNKVELREEIGTIFGTLTLISAIKP